MLYVDIPTRDDIRELVTERGPARVSIYLPTTPVTREAQADRTALKNLANEALKQLAGHDKREVRVIEEELLDLVDDTEFWDFQANSLAVFVTPEHLRTFRLPSRLQARVEVGDRFFVKPLLRAVTAPQSAYVLALSQNGVRVVEVSGDLPAAPVKVDGMPKDAASFVGRASLADRSPSGRIQGDEGLKVRLVQYARRVDRVLRDLLGGHETPLILAAAEPLRSIYRSVQSYPHLAAGTIDGNPDTTTDAELAAAARGVLDERFAAELAGLRKLYGERFAEGRATADVAQAARAATAGAVQTLLIDIDEVLPGTMDERGAVTFAQEADKTNHGLIDEIAGRALLTGARVLAVRRDDLPGGGGLAAILRYAF